MPAFFLNYETGDFFDEMFGAPDSPRPHYKKLFERFRDMGAEEFSRKQAIATNTFLNHGVTFTVYNDNQGTERIFPFDLIPRIIPQTEWERVERGLEQRITALNMFLHDVYHDQRILKEKIIPEEVVRSAVHF